MPFKEGEEQRREEDVPRAGGVGEQVAEEDGLGAWDGDGGFCLRVDGLDDGLGGEGGEVRGYVCVGGEEAAVDELEGGDGGQELGHGG